MPKRRATDAEDLTATLPWDRQRGEGEEAYRAFVVYRDLAANRSQAAAARRLLPTYQQAAADRAQIRAAVASAENQDKSGTSRARAPKRGEKGPTLDSLTRRMAEFARNHDWVERCRLWDIQQQRIADALKATQREKLKTEHAGVARQLLAAASRLVQPPFDLTDAAARGDADAIAKLARWRPDHNALRSASDAINSAVRNERLSADMPTEITRAEVTLKEQLKEASEVNGALIRVLEEHLCDDCRDRVLAELERVARLHQQATASVATL